MQGCSDARRSRQAQRARCPDQSPSSTRMRRRLSCMHISTSWITSPQSASTRQTLIGATCALRLFFFLLLFWCVYVCGVYACVCSLNSLFQKARAVKFLLLLCLRAFVIIDYVEIPCAILFPSLFSQRLCPCVSQGPGVHSLQQYYR